MSSITVFVLAAYISKQILCIQTIQDQALQVLKPVRFSFPIILSCFQNQT